ncbi:MAG TPA: hypothetical protein VGG06_34420 [Thermoanaerobaculia bacterium]
MARKKLSHGCKSQLENYYGEPRCIIDGTTHVEYHHLDDDDTNTTFVNLIPLGANWNCPVLRDARRTRRLDRDVDLPAQLEPDYLIREAAQHFARWHTPQAYGCARLAHFIARSYLRWAGEHRVALASDALYYARQSLNYELIADCLIRDILPLLREQLISSALGGTIAADLAGLLSEHGLHRDASWLYAQSGTNADSVRESALLRRMALRVVAEEGLTADAEAMLRDSMSVNPNSPNLAASIANTRAWCLIAERRYAESLDLLEPLVQRYRRRVLTEGGHLLHNNPNVSAWNVAEIFHSYSVATYHVGGRRQEKSASALRAADEVYRRCQTGPFPLREGIWEQEAGFHEDAQRRGIATIRRVVRLPPAVRLLVDEAARWLTRA